MYVRDNPLLRIDPDGLTDITFTVQRTQETKQSTMGNFVLSNRGNESVVSGATLEKPWKNNMEFESRIPAGSYDAKLRTDNGTFNYPRIALKNVPGREGPIVVHRGNDPGNTTGCILVGKSGGKDRVNNSQDATTEISDYVQAIQAEDQNGGEKTTITVIVIDPPKKEEKADVK